MNFPVMFCDVYVGKLFQMNGNDYLKQSTRTARMLSNGRVFYIARNEIVFRIAQ